LSRAALSLKARLSEVPLQALLLLSLL